MQPGGGSGGHITCAMTWDTQQIPACGQNSHRGTLLHEWGFGAPGALQGYGTVKCCRGRSRCKALGTRGFGGVLTNFTRQHLPSIRMLFET